MYITCWQSCREPKISDQNMQKPCTCGIYILSEEMNKQTVYDKCHKKSNRVREIRSIAGGALFFIGGLGMPL